VASRRLQVVLDLDTGRYSGRMKNAASQMQVFSGVVNNSSNSVRTLSRSFDSLNRGMSSPLQKLRDYVLILGNVRLAILNVRDIAVGWVGAMIQQSAQVERLMMLMKGLSNAAGDVGKQKDAVNNMRMVFQEARRSGFAVDNLADAFVKLKSGGLDPADGSLRSLTNAVAAFGGTSETMHRASIAIQQMAGKGVISMEELRQQLGEAVPTAMADMARAMGMSVKEFTKLVAKGVVQAKPALELMFMEFDRLYGGAGERMARTLQGQMANFKTNLTELSTFFTQFNTETGRAEEGGLYDTFTKGLKELNQALQSSEGRQAARELGEVIASVARAVANAARFVIEFRNEFALAGKIALSAFLAVKASNIIAWMITGFTQAALSFRGFSLAMMQGSTTGAASIGTITRSLAVKSAAMERLIASRTRNIASIRAEAAATTTQSNAYRQRVLNLQAEQTMLRNKVMAERAAIAAAQQAEMVARANIATGTRLQASIAQVTASRRAQTLGAIRLAAAERALIANKTALTTATRLATAADTASTAALARQATATHAVTIAMRAKAVALGVAAAATRTLAVAMNLALGPLGLIALALYAAADAAGVFENRANRAADAAARLKAGIASIEDIEKLNARAQEIADANRRDQKTLDEGGSWRSVRTRDGNESRWVPLSQEERTRIGGDIAKRNQELASNRETVAFGRSTLARQNGQQDASMIISGIQDRLADKEDRYRQVARSDATPKEKDAAAEELAAARKAEFDNAKAKVDRDILNARRLGRTDEVARLREVREQLNQNTGAVENLTERTRRLREEAVGAADEQKKEQKAKRETLDQYTRMIAQQKGDIAELKAEAEGAEGALAQFNARLAAGMYPDATKEQIEELRKGFAEIDQLKANNRWAASMRELNRELAQGAEAAKGLWEALEKDSTGVALQQYRRSEAARAQFADKLAAAQATGDPKKIEEVTAKINELVDTLSKAEAVFITDQWREMAEEIHLSLLNEDEAREQNFQRELARQQQLLNRILENSEIEADRKILAQKRFEDWKRLSEERLARDNEIATTRMMRDWAMLGQNIEQSLAGAMNAFVDGMFDAEFNFVDFAASLIKELLKIIVKAMIAYAILSSLGLANNSSGQPVSFKEFMGGQISAGFGGTRDPSTAIGSKAGTGSNLQQPLPPPAPPRTPFGRVTIAHTGGIIGKLSQSAAVDPAVFAKAKSYHTGTNSIGGRALRPGEVPMIGMEGEAVLTREHQRMVANALRGANGNAPPVTVNIINNSGTDLDAEQGEPEFNAKEMVIGVVVEAAQKQGPLRDILSSMRG
jgi:tape measure domain-containing protein